jgi:lauroyl/myristoyl acyltransferase
MAETVRQLRRAATQLAIRQAIMASAMLPIGTQLSIVRSLISRADVIPMLRWKLRENMRLALGYEVPAQVVNLYFRHVGWFLSSSLATYHHGVAATPVPQEIKFDESIRLLDEAVAEGRGVVLTSAHWSGHELVGPIINSRYPVTLLVRQAPTAERTARKLKWYNALGVETVLRPMRASTIKDAVAYLSVLKKGKLLAITPDLLADPGQGVETIIFGRQARLHAGAFAIAIAAKAPMLRLFFRWQSDTSLIAVWERAPSIIGGSDREAAIRASAQDWCLWFEEKLRMNPENWLFWLDKSWSHFLRATPRMSGAE